MKAIRSRNRQSKPLPLLDRTVKAEEVLFPLVKTQPIPLIGMIKIDQKEFFPRYQNILELEIPMKEASLVKSTNEQSSGADNASLPENSFTRGLSLDLMEILNEMLSLWNFK